MGYAKAFRQMPGAIVLGLAASAAAPALAGEYGFLFEASVQGSALGVSASAAMSASQPGAAGSLLGLSAGTVVTVAAVEYSAGRGGLLLRAGPGGNPIPVAVPAKRLRAAGVRPGDSVEVRHGAGGAMLSANGNELVFLLDGNGNALLRSSSHGNPRGDAK